MTDAFDFLLDAYARIGECLPLLQAADDLVFVRKHGHVEQILANIYEDILKFHCRAVVFFKQRSKYTFGSLFQSVLTVTQHGRSLSKPHFRRSLIFTET